METSHGLRRHGFIILLLVIFVPSVSCFDSKINGSYDSRGTKIHNDRKRILSGSRSGNIPQWGQEKPLCALHKPTKSGKLFSPFCLEGYVISEIKFADYGQPTGLCETFKHGKCGAPATLGLVKKNCHGKRRCRLFVTDEMFGPTHCKGPVSLAFLATCTKRT